MEWGGRSTINHAEDEENPQLVGSRDGQREGKRGLRTTIDINSNESDQQY